MIIHTDGSALESSSALCVIRGKDKFTKVFEESYPVIMIEYLAIIKGLEIASQGDELFTDSYQAFLELNLLRRVTSDYIFPLWQKAIKLSKSKSIRVNKIKREKNLAGIYLENRLTELKRYSNSTCRRINKRKYIKKRI